MGYHPNDNYQPNEKYDSGSDPPPGICRGSCRMGKGCSCQ